MQSNSNSNNEVNAIVCKHAINYAKQLKKRFHRFHMLYTLNKQQAQKLGKQLLLNLKFYNALCKNVGFTCEANMQMIQRALQRKLD